MSSIEEEADSIMSVEDPTRLITDQTIAMMWDKYDTDANGFLDRCASRPLTPARARRCLFVPWTLCTPKRCLFIGFAMYHFACVRAPRSFVAIM